MIVINKTQIKTQNQSSNEIRNHFRNHFSFHFRNENSKKYSQNIFTKNSLYDKIYLGVKYYKGVLFMSVHMNDEELKQLSIISDKLKEIVDTVQNNVVQYADNMGADDMVRTMKALNHITTAQMELVNAVKLLPQNVIQDLAV